MLRRLIFSRAVVPGTGLEFDAALAKSVRRKFVTVAGDAEPDCSIHQTRLIKGDVAVGIGVITKAAGGFQFDHRHAAPGLFVDHLDGEIIVEVERRLRGADRCNNSRNKSPTSTCLAEKSKYSAVNKPALPKVIAADGIAS